MKFFISLRQFFYRLRAMRNTKRTLAEKVVDASGYDLEPEAWPDNIIQLDIWKDL